MFLYNYKSIYTSKINLSKNIKNYPLLDFSILLYFFNKNVKIVEIRILNKNI